MWEREEGRGSCIQGHMIINGVTCIEHVRGKENNDKQMRGISR